MGLSLLISCWTFYRISGGLFNPAVTLSLLLAGCITPFRAAILTVAQLLGGIAGAALVNGTTVGGVANVVTTLADGMSTGQGVSCVYSIWSGWRARKLTLRPVAVGS